MRSLINAWLCARLREWARFLTIAIHPLSVLLILASAALVYTSTSMATSTANTVAPAMLTVTASVLTGVLGAFVWKRWSEMTEHSVLVARGKAAIRNIIHLSNNITELEKRVQTYMDHHSASRNRGSLLLTYFEEIIARCRTIQGNAMNAISSWTDVIPEADVNSIAGHLVVMNDLRAQVDDLSKDRAALTEELESSKQKSDDEIQTLLRQKDQVQKRLDKASADLAKQEHALRSSVFGGLDPSTFGPGSGVASVHILPCGSIIRVGESPGSYSHKRSGVGSGAERSNR